MKRARIVWIVAGVLVLGGLMVYLIPPKEPSYDGRALSTWISRYDNARIHRDFPNRQSVLQVSEQAVKSIGTNAIPTLLNWLQSSNSSLGEKLNPVLEKQSFITFRFQSIYDRWSMAVQGFEIIGHDGLPAVPTLTRLLRDPDKYVRMRALNCLFFIDHDKKERLPIIFQLIHGTDDNILAPSAFYIYKTYPDLAETAGVYKILPKLKRPTANVVSTNVPTRE